MGGKPGGQLSVDLNNSKLFITHFFYRPTYSPLIL